MKKTIWEKLTGAHITEAILEQITETFRDFSPVRQGYLAAMEKLAETQGDLCRTVTDAIQSQLQSLVLFSGMLGLKANWDHFVNPTARSFLEADTEVYLREQTARSLPAYEAARRARDGFFARLSPEEQDIYDAVIAYICYLETVAPKLAHYYGYLLGNELLPQVIPGYHPDIQQTFHYKDTLMHWIYENPAA